MRQLLPTLGTLSGESGNAYYSTFCPTMTGVIPNRFFSVRRQSHTLIYVFGFRATAPDYNDGTPTCGERPWGESIDASDALCSMRADHR